MSVLLSEIVAEFSLGLQLVAGGSDLDSRGPILWIHSSELPDPTRWLRGGEIFLTTGFGLRRSPALQRQLIVNLDKLGCIGLGLGLGDWLKVLPEVMLKEAKRRKFPIFTVPYTSSFSIVSKFVAGRIFEDQHSKSQLAPDAPRHLLAQVLAGSDVRTLTQAFMLRSPKSETILFDYYGEPLISSPPSAPAAAIWRAIVPHRHRDRFSAKLADRTLLGGVVCVDDSREAVFVVASANALTEQEQLQFEQTLIGIRLAMRRGQLPREARRSQFGELLTDIMDGALVPAVIGRKLSRWGWDSRSGYQVAAIVPAAKTDMARLAASIEDELANEGGAPAVTCFQDRVYCFITDGDNSLRVLRKALQHGRLAKFGIGLSRLRHEAHEIAVSVKEADLAGNNAKIGNMECITNLGLSGLVPHIQNDKSATEIIVRVLDPIEQYDRQHGGSVLRNTLQAFVNAGFRPGVAAKALKIHRHTLGYRLNQIGRLTSRDVKKSEHLLELSFALSLANSSRPRS